MKKILLTILLTVTPAYAFEEYMIISNMPVKSVTVQNPEIVKVQPVFTIDNEKKIIILTPLTNGKTKINIERVNDKKTLEVKISEDLTKIKPQDGFNYFSIDIPPENFIIPLPPANEILPKPPKGGK